MKMLMQLALLVAFAATSVQADPDYKWLSCTKGPGKCGYRVEVQAHVDEKHGLRCCSDTAKSGWKKKGGCGIWNEADLTPLDDTVKQCFLDVTYTDAVAICEHNDAYVCTKEQVDSECAKSSGCELDGKMIWTSGEAPTPPEAPGQETIGEDEYMFLACGSGLKGDGDNQCGNTVLKVAKAGEKHGVRCCNAAPADRTGWGRDSLPCVNFHRSNLLGLDDADDAETQCFDEVTYAEAQEICARNDGYVCTMDQVVEQCAQGSGCNFDKKYIWTSNTGSPEDIAALVAKKKQEAQANEITGVCSGTTGRVWGDPHFTSFDGLKYDCQGHGEFVIAMSTGSDPLAIHGRFVQRKADAIKPTVTGSIAIKVLEDVPVIHVTVPDQKIDGACPFSYSIGDDETPVSDIISYVAENYDGKVNAFTKGKNLIFTYEATGTRVVLTAGGSGRCVINTNLCLSPENHGGAGNIVGLLGTPTGNKEDDWINRDGSTTPLPAECDGDYQSCKQTLKKEGHDWCMANWCVGHGDNSLWKPETHALYNQCDDTGFDPFFEKVPTQEIIDACAETEDPDACETDAVAEVEDGGNLDEFVESVKEDDEDDKLIEKIESGEEPLDDLEGTISNTEAAEIVDIPEEFPDVPAPDAPAPAPVSDSSGSLGDPHFKTWQGEHFEYHGQCDMILTKDHKFADDLGLEVQIRTKLVRFWSYISRAAIRIGEDILEIEGSADNKDRDTHYWFNFQRKGKTTSIGGFPLTISHNGVHKSTFEIDLSSKYPGQMIVLSTFREFVRVDFKNTSAEAFGNTVGMLGDFKTGHLYARDGARKINDFLELGNEWQLLPSDDMLFHDKAEPQFPRRCLLPEDPQGERRRRLSESTITVEEAEAACSKGLTDSLDVKDCVYDILATQDLDMVGAF